MVITGYHKSTQIHLSAGELNVAMTARKEARNFFCAPADKCV